MSSKTISKTQWNLLTYTYLQIQAVKRHLLQCCGFMFAYFQNRPTLEVNIVRSDLCSGQMQHQCFQGHKKDNLCILIIFSPLLRDNQDLYCFWRMNRVQSQHSAWTISKHQSVTLQTITSLGLIASSLSKLVITLILWRSSDDKLFQSMTNVLFVSMCAHGHLCVCVCVSQGPSQHWQIKGARGWRVREEGT